MRSDTKKSSKQYRDRNYNCATWWDQIAQSCSCEQQSRPVDARERWSRPVDARVVSLVMGAANQEVVYRETRESIVDARSVFRVLRARVAPGFLDMWEVRNPPPRPTMTPKLAAVGTFAVPWCSDRLYVQPFRHQPRNRRTLQACLGRPATSW
jgi:hypothetical protein